MLNDVRNDCSAVIDEHGVSFLIEKSALCAIGLCPEPGLSSQSFLGNSRKVRFEASGPMSGFGRVREITNGCFVEAKQEKRWLAVRLLWSNPTGRFGSK